MAETGGSAPRLGLHLSNHAPTGGHITLARAAEDAGLDSVWISEDLYFRGAVPLAGAIAAVTSRIDIGFGVLTPYSRHVSLLAMDMASLLDIAGPRVIVGLGAGVEARTRAMKVTYGDPVLAVREVVDAFRRLMAGESVTYDGIVDSADGLRLTFDDRLPNPRVFVAAIGPKALTQAGAIADGVLLSLMASPQHIGWARERIAAGAKAGGRDAAVPLVVYVPLSLADRREDAIASMKPYIAYFVRRWAPIPSLAQLFTRWGPIGPDELTRMARELEDGRSADDVISDELVTTYCVAGTIDDCCRQVSELGDIGITDVVFDAGGTTAEATVRSAARIRAAMHSPARAP